MTKVSKDVYQKVLDELYAEGVFMKEILPSFKDIDFSTSAVKNILESSNDLFYDVTDDKLKYIIRDGENERFEIAPDLSAGMTESATWLSNKLPTPPFDFEQGGDLRKVREAKSIYTVLCVAICFKTYRPEVLKFFTNYDFDQMEVKFGYLDYTSATDYLESFSSMDSLNVNVVISSASLVISRTIDKKGEYWQSSLNTEEITELGRISREVKNI